MPYTTPPAKVAGDLLTADNWNTHLRANLEYFRALLNGSGSEKLPTLFFLGSLGVKEDYYEGAYTRGVASNVLYDKTGQYWEVYLNGDTPGSSSPRLRLDAANGKLSGKGFFSSGEITVGEFVAVNVAHGLGARPRFVMAYYSLTAGGEKDRVAVPNYPATSSSMQIQQVNATNIVLYNNGAATAGNPVYVEVHAML